MQGRKPGAITRKADNRQAEKLMVFSNVDSRRKSRSVQLQQSFPRSLLAKAINLNLSQLHLGKVLALAATVTSAPLLAQSFPAQIDLSDLNGSNGFVINGANAFDRAGISVSAAGDFNGDGVADIIVGADGVDPDGRINAGASYIVFGATGVGSSGELNLSSLNGTTGFVINGIASIYRTGNKVSHAGDFNGDGISDVIIGAPSALGNSGNNLTWRGGQSYIVFGGNEVGNTGTLELSALNGSNGLTIFGSRLSDSLGGSVSSAGDFNGDGLSDVVIGAPGASNGSAYDAGASYVIFGGAQEGTGGNLLVTDLDLPNGITVGGSGRAHFSGFAVSGAGDVDGDGFSDVLIGAPGLGVYGNYSNRSVLVFGGANADLADYDSLNIEAKSRSIRNEQNPDVGDSREQLGRSVSSAGDINGDGFADFMLSASPVNYDNFAPLGAESYVIFGGEDLSDQFRIELDDLNPDIGFEILNNEGMADHRVNAVGDLNGDGVDDVVIGARLTDANGKFTSGVSYVVFGSESIGAEGPINLLTLDGRNGFAINGIDVGDQSGASVSAAGDINGDGLSDLIIGAPFGDPNGNRGAGESFVLFGVASDTPPLLTCNGLEVTVNIAAGEFGTGGDDVILGTPGADDIRAFGGNDTICGLGGDDFIRAGAGNDFIIGGAGEDHIRGDSGNDVIYGNTGNDLLDGGGGNDEIYALAGDDTLLGRSGSDLLDGGDGLDSINGGDGSDTIYTGAGFTVGTGVFATGGAGDDTLYGGPDASDLRGWGGNDTIFGSPFGDFISGGAGRDELHGGDGWDEIYGNGGDDRLFGDEKRDFLSGGGGNDFLDGGFDENDFLNLDTCEGNAGTDTAVGCEVISTVP